MIAHFDQYVEFVLVLILTSDVVSSVKGLLLMEFLFSLIYLHINNGPAGNSRIVKKLWYL